MRMLKSFGCSFIFGSDLTDSTDQIASSLTWPAHLANHLGYEYGCYARGGTGNFQILQQILNQLCFTNNDFFVVGWTWSDRFDYGPDLNFGQTVSSCKLKTLRPTSKTKLAQIYYKNLQSEYQDKLQTLIYIKTAIDVLHQKNIPFVMTFMDDFLLESKWQSDQLAIRYLQEQVAPHLTTFNGLNFYKWSQQNNFPISDAWHPLEQAHQAAADYMIKIFDKQKTNDPVRPVLS
jgi:hypothetical protein